MEPITSIEEFIGRLKRLKQEIGYEYYYRGHSDFHFKLTPTIYRPRKGKPSFVTNEERIFREAILRTPQEFANENTTIEKLVKMQLYGLPTRILDITSNPLVALYFACNEKSNQHDGEVVALKIPKAHIKHYDSDTVSILANLSRRSALFNISKALAVYKEAIENPEFDTKFFGEEEAHYQAVRKFNHTDPIPYLLHEIKDEKPQFMSIIEPTDFGRVLAVRVKLNNDRIQKQAGAFLLFGIDKKKHLPAKVSSKWMLNKPSHGLNLRIAAGSKDEIKVDLDKLGINKSTLYPEIEHQSKYIKEMF